MQIEVDNDFTDEIVREALRQAYNHMVVRDGAIPYVSHNFDEECERVYQLRAALRLVHNYFAARSEHIDAPEGW